MGTRLFSLLSDNESLKQLFSAGETSWNKWKLHEELTVICKNLKKVNNGNSKVSGPASATEEIKSLCKKNCKGICICKRSTKSSDPIITIPMQPVPSDAPGAFVADTDLYNACKQKADTAYKMNMADRAVLFSQVPADQYQLVNRSDLVASRKDLCLKIIQDNKEVSKLYDKADHVKKHGNLPSQKPVKNNKVIPDHLVKQKLDNLKKNIDKKKKREQTPERIAMIQQDESELKILEARWLILNPKNKK